MKKIVLLVSLVFVILSGQEMGQPFLNNIMVEKVYHVVFTNNNTNLVTMEKKAIKLWDLKSNKLLKTIKKKGYYVLPSVSLDNKYLAINTNSRLELWDFKKKKIIRTLKMSSNTLYSIMITPDNRYVILGYKDQAEIKAWDIKTGELKTLFKVGYKENKDVLLTCSSDNQYLVVSGSDKSLRLWDFNRNKVINTFKGHTSEVTTLSISEDNQYIASGSYTDGVKIWDLESGRLVKNLNSKSRGHPTSIVFSKDNKNLVVAYEYEIQLWDLVTENVLKHFDKERVVNINSIILDKQNRYIIAGTDKGTIFWDIKSGKKLLSLLSFDNEWVAISDNGYFSGSKGSENYLNVINSRGKTVPIYAYSEKFHRPDIVKFAMQGINIEKTTKMSTIKSAPTIEILGLQQTTTNKQIEVTLKLKDMGGGIGDIRIYRNGVAVNLESRTIQRSQQGVVTKRYIIPLEKGKNKIEAIAFERTNSAKSEPSAMAHIMANYNSTHAKPTLHAVIIGIEEFRNEKLNLRYSKNDAKALKESLEQYAKPLFESIDVTLLTSKEETSKKSISKVLDRMKSLNPNDMFLLFVASHGLVDDGEFYLLTSNVGNLSKRKLHKTALSQTEITKLISNIPTGKKLIILDTCYSEALGDSIKVALLTRGMSKDTAIKILSRATGTTILSASLSTQQALEGYKGHGLFSYVLLEGLKKEADLNGDGFVKTSELVDYVEERVPEISKEVFGVEQFPTASWDGRVFPVTKTGRGL